MTSQSEPPNGSRLPGLTPRSALVGIGLIVLGSYWVQQVSLISHTCQVAEGVPSVPALMGLLMLSGLVMLFRVRKGPVRQELLVIYTMLSLGVTLSSDNVMRQLFPAITSLRYFAGPENDFALFAEQTPAWLTIADDEVARRFCEASDTGAVPWGAWALPLTTWAGVFVLYTLSLYCLLALFRRPWADHEHLGYPLVQLALDLTPGGDREPGHRHVLRQPLFWLGFALGALFNAQNIANAFSPQFPALGTSYNLGALLTQEPWTGLRPLTLTFRPEIVGLGYMVPVDILFSSWFFYLLLRFQNFFARLFGYSIPEFPFEPQQGHGAYLGLAVMVVYAARRHLGEVFQAAVMGKEADDRNEAMPYPVAFWGTIAGFAGLVMMCLALSLPFSVAVAFVGMISVSALVYGRIRAQTGLPVSYIVPRRDIYQAIYDAWTSPGSFSAVRLRAESNFAVLTVINRMVFAQLAAYEMEGGRAGDLARIRRSHVLLGILLGLAVGTFMGYWTHLTAAYFYGNNVLDGGTTEGGWRTRQSVIQYEYLQQRSVAPTVFKTAPFIARGVGFALTIVLLGLRAKFLRFPLHPMGLAIAATYGGQVWFPVFVVWLCKTLILRLGGARLYRQVTAPFLGLAVGHMLIAGGVWGLVGTIDEDVGRRYLVWFT